MNNPEIIIYNVDDVTEQRIKSILFGGEIFSGWTAAFNQIGLEYLGVPNLNGGKQRNIAKKILLQYANFVPMEKGKNKIICKEVYEIPHYNEPVEDNRGKRGFYKERAIPILLSWLLNLKDDRIVTSVDSLSQTVGLIRKEWKDVTLNNDIENVNEKFTKSMINHLSCRCRPRQNSTIYNMLDIMQRDFDAFEYEKQYYIVTEENKRKAMQCESELIKDIEQFVLEKYNAKTIVDIQKRNKLKSFYNDVYDLINSICFSKWKSYYSKIFIKVDKELLLEEMKKKGIEVMHEEGLIEELKCEISEHFATTALNQTKKEYNYTNENALKRIEKHRIEIENNMELVNLSDEMKELYELGIYSKENIIEQHMKDYTKKQFIYHDNYITVQKDLIKYLIGEPKEELMDNEEIVVW